MLGILLVVIGSFLDEIGMSVGKQSAKRSSTVIFSVVSGSAVFHEKKVGVKIIATFACIAGILLLNF